MKIAFAINRLKEKGHRVTNARKAMVKLFSSSTKPLSASDVMGALYRIGLVVNKTTVYREIGFLLKEGFIQEIHIDSSKVFYESTSMIHHHHFICNNCGTLEDIFLDNELEITEKKLEQEKKFRIERHSLEFFGVCNNCQ